MQQYAYKKYKSYREVQIAEHDRKRDRVFVQKANVSMLSEYIRCAVAGLRFGICHGSRTGAEQVWFRECLGIEVIGTDIAPSAKYAPHTIVWDFNKLNESWVGAADFVYSNALDHAFNAKQTLQVWMGQLVADGLCIVEWTPQHVHSTKGDPFGATLEEYQAMFAESFEVVDTLHVDDSAFIVARNR